MGKGDNLGLKITASIVAAAAAPFVIILAGNTINESLHPSEPTVQTCSYIPEASVNAAKHALDLANGDKAKAKIQAKELIEQYYGTQCSEVVVSGAKQSSVDWISEHSNTYEYKSDSQSAGKKDPVEINCVEQEGYPYRVISYIDGVVPDITELTSDLWAGARCEVAPGEFKQFYTRDLQLVLISGK